MFRHVLRNVVGLATLVLAVQTFVAIGWLRPVVVAGDSMEPALVGGQRVLVRRWPTPQRWDKVVLRSPEDPRRLIVKRIVGLPGEHVAFRSGAVWADGRLRNQPEGQSVYYGAPGTPTWEVGAGEWLVAGDNQPVSIDSRNWGHAPGVPARLIVGVLAD